MIHTYATILLRWFTSAVEILAMRSAGIRDTGYVKGYALAIRYSSDIAIASAR